MEWEIQDPVRWRRVSVAEGHTMGIEELQKDSIHRKEVVDGYKTSKGGRKYAIGRGQANFWRVGRPDRRDNV